MANLKELSELLGLSQTTVSRALNGYPEVSETTRMRVQRAAARHNYTPNPSARGLATGKALTIGHVVPLADHDMINPHFADFIGAAGRVYQERGYDMLLSVVDADDQEKAYAKLKRDRRVDGVIVHGPLADDPRIAMLKELDIPFVVHGRTLDDETSYRWVDVNNRRAFRQVTAHLTTLSHRRIALINGIETMVFAIKRREGYEVALADAGIATDTDLIVSGDMTEPLGFNAVKGFMRLDDPPTAVVCASMLPAMGAVRAIQESGLIPGKDISVVSHDDCLSFMLSGIGELTMTVMRSGIGDAGRAAATMLIDLIEGLPTPDHILLEARFVHGNTSGPPRNSN